MCGWNENELFCCHITAEQAKPNKRFDLFDIFTRKPN